MTSTDPSTSAADSSLNPSAPSFSPIDPQNPTFPPAPTSSSSKPASDRTTTQAINIEPIELDGTPASPEIVKRFSGRKGSLAMGLVPRRGTGGTEGTEGGEEGRGGVREEGVPEGYEEDEDLSPEERTKREALLKQRSGDAAVLVDIPKEPDANDVQAVGDSDP